VCAIGYDFIIFCLRRFYSRSIFYIFTDKLKRLKAERAEIVIIMKTLINKYIHDIDPDYDSSRIIKNDLVDSSKDDLKYLEGRFQKRRTSVEMIREIERLESNQ
jgi:hypothetical protein